MHLPFLYLLIALLVFLPVTIVVFVVLKTRSAHRINQKVHDRLHLNQYEIALYSYNSDVQYIADITAKSFGAYRDLGVIESYGKSFFDYVFHPDEKTVFELGNILMLAKEVKRINDSTTLYFFTEHIMKTANTPEVTEIINAISQHTDKKKNVLMSVTKQLAEADQHDAHNSN